MSFSIYQAAIPTLLRQLQQLSEILKKAERHAETENIEAGIFLQARLAPDMYPLTRQVQLTSDSAKGCAARLAGIEVPSYPDDETTFSQLQERLTKTIAFIQSVPEAKFAGSDSRPVVIKLRDRELSFSGDQYLLNFVLPNVFFHMSMTYAILRHTGVKLGKQDYLGPQA